MRPRTSKLRLLLAGAASAASAATLAVPASAAPPAARDGYWRTSSSGVLVELRVVDHRVVGVLADVQTATVGSPDLECGRRLDGFVGPFTGASRSTRRGFTVQAPPSSLRITGRVVSATRITGTVRILASSGDQCAAQRSFTARYASAD